MRATIKAEYEAANQAFNITWAKRQEASAAHLAGGSFDDFLAAKAAHEINVARYDAAFAAMAELPEETNEPAEPEQFELFAA